MSIVKVYCSQCGQRVSGDESFYGTVHRCPICSADIRFPEKPPASPSLTIPPPPAPPADSSRPPIGDNPAPIPSQAPVSGDSQPAVPAPAPEPVPPAPAPAPAVLEPDPKAATPPRQRDPIPLYVLGAGVASLIPCIGLIAGPVAIILGHLTLIRLHDDLPPNERNKVLLGTCLGYVSLLFLLIFAVIWKLKGAVLRAAILGQ
jgi:hypothetical protein